MTNTELKASLKKAEELRTLKNDTVKAAHIVIERHSLTSEFEAELQTLQLARMQQA